MAKDKKKNNESKKAKKVRNVEWENLNPELPLQINQKENLQVLTEPLM